MKKTLLFSSVALLGAMLLFAAPYGSVTFFDGTKKSTTSGVTLLSTNTFTGRLFAGQAISDISSVVESNHWTTTQAVSANSITLVLGGYNNYGTNYITLGGAGSNDANAEYFYAPCAGDTDGSRYTNHLKHAIVLVGSYWLCTNAQGKTNYRKPATLGLPGATGWAVVDPGVAPVFTSCFWSDADTKPVTLTLRGSYDKSNWFSMANVAVTPVASNWAAGYATVTLTNVGYLTTYGGTNANTNGSYFTNAYLHGYYK